MEWSKIKNIVILLLVLTNLCLLGLVVQEDRETRQLEREALENMVGFLHERGIQIQQNIVPETMELPIQQVERQLDQEQSMAETLLEGNVSVSALGGQVYRYAGPLGNVQFHNDGTFSAQLNPSILPPEGERTPDWMQKFLFERLEFQGDLLESGQNFAVFRQLWNRVPLLNHRVEVHWSQDEVQITGRRLMGEPMSSKTLYDMTVPTALMDIFTGLNRLGDVCSQITQIQQSYASVSNLHGPMTLRPVWYIATDTGFYQLDIVSGTLTRATF